MFLGAEQLGKLVQAVMHKNCIREGPETPNILRFYMAFISPSRQIGMNNLHEYLLSLKAQW